MFKIHKGWVSGLPNGAAVRTRELHPSEVLGHLSQKRPSTQEESS